MDDEEILRNDKRQKPMWFWSGQTVEEDEIADVKAYNRANGIIAK